MGQPAPESVKIQSPVTGIPGLQGCVTADAFDAENKGEKATIEYLKQRILEAEK